LAVGLPLLQARRSGTHYRPSFVVCPSVLATLDARIVRAISKRNRDALHNIALYKFLILFYSILYTHLIRYDTIERSVTLKVR